MDERFAVPGAGGIITKTINGIEYIVIQYRSKDGSETENGLIEIPAGKIKEYENIYDCLRREIQEETGLIVEEIEGEKKSKIIEINGYKVLTYEPYSSSQNISGYYPIMVQVFICHVKEDTITIKESNELKNIRWVELKVINELLKENKKMFYPMHITTLAKYCGEKMT